MYRSICSTLLLLGLFSFNVSAQEDCSATKYAYKQCLFDIPELKDGQETTSSFSEFGLIGGVISKCTNGTASFGAAICKPEDESSCVIPETVWGDESGYCKHSSMPGVLENGSTKIALSETNSEGRIVYSCESGSLKKETSFCSGLSGQSESKVSGQYSSTVFGVQYETCDAAIVLGKVGSNENGRIEDELCNVSGFTTLDRVFSAEPYSARSGSGDNFYHVEAMCSGNTNANTACFTPPSDDGMVADFIQTIDCNQASVAGVVNSPNGSSPANTVVESALCVDNGYSTMDSLQRISWIDPSEDKTDGTTHYAEVICSGNSNAGSMCQSTNSTTVNILDCDSAAISGDIDGTLTVSETRPPSEAQVQAELCVINGYASLKEVTKFTFDPSGLRGVYEVDAICEANTAPAQNCKNSCMGQLVTDNSALPKIQGSDGKYYLDICADDLVPPEGFCQDCENADITFFDAGTGNTCTLTNQNVFTGEVKDIDFANTDFNGTANVSCNSSETTVTSGECYKTCKGGSRSVWRDSYGANSCGAVIPAGDYYQGETVSLGTDINTGSSVFKCDDGAWVQQGASQCLLDCDGGFSWGSGVSANGLNKNGVCRANAGLIKHGSSTSNSLASITPFTDGESKASCNNGVVTASSSRCDLDCRSETGYWGAGRCSSTVPNTDNDDSVTVNTPTPLTGYSGSALFVCGDGDLTLGSSTCYQDCPAQTLSVNSCSFSVNAGKHNSKTPYTRSTGTVEADISHTCKDGNWKLDSGSYCSSGVVVYGSWSGWTLDGGKYAFGAWTPSASDFYTDESVDQTRTYKQNRTRSRAVYMTFPPSSRRDFVRNESVSGTITGNEQNAVFGTKVKSSLIWVKANIIHYEQPMHYSSSMYVQQQNPGCTGPDGETKNTPEVNLGDACAVEGEEAYYSFSCAYEDGYCQPQSGDDSRCGSFFGEGKLAVCASSSSDPELAGCARVDVDVTYTNDGSYEEAVADTSACAGNVSVSIEIAKTTEYNLESDNSCAGVINGEKVTAHARLPNDWEVNTQYGCRVEAEFTFKKGSGTYTITKTVEEEFERECQVDTGSSRC